MLSLTLFDNPYRVIVCSAATSSDKLLHALKLAKPLFISAFFLTSLLKPGFFVKSSLYFLFLTLKNKELCAIREPIANILCHLKQQTGIRFYTAISTLADQTEQAAAAHTDALRAFILSHIWTWKMMYMTIPWSATKKPSFSPSSIAYDPMITCIEHNDPDEIKRCCAQFVHSLFFYTTASAWFYPRHVYSRTDKHPCALSCKTHRTFTRRAYTPRWCAVMSHNHRTKFEWLTAGFLSLSES